jgi:hypothetical protein
VKPIASPVQRSDWHLPLSASALLHALGRGLARSIGIVRTYVVEHRNARAGEELYRHLSRLSDAELARRGLGREQVAQLVKGRF